MKLSFDKKKNIACIRLTGSVDKETILGAFDAAVAHPQYTPGMGRLWDFRDADLSQLTTAAIESMTRHSQQFPPGINDVKVAFVATRGLEFGLARMFEAYSTDTRVAVSVFYSLEEAEDWMAGGET